ncbi:MAG: hypothetical protein BMS9Abin15_0241 [Gammaproteobacteria bacterium]|nr:MAG: hypothetical protein BMS9Abin15_0241 [Gammaproteobacteria bacterium]
MNQENSNFSINTGNTDRNRFLEDIMGKMLIDALQNKATDVQVSSAYKSLCDQGMGIRSILRMVMQQLDEIQRERLINLIRSDTSMPRG